MHGDLHGGGMTEYLLLERALCNCEDQPDASDCPFHGVGEDEVDQSDG